MGEHTQATKVFKFRRLCYLRTAGSLYFNILPFKVYQIIMPDTMHNKKITMRNFGK